MWKINYKNLNLIQPFKTEKLRVMSWRTVVRNLTCLAVVFFVIMMTSAGFHSASSLCSGSLTTVPVQVNIVSFLCISQQLCLFLFWRWAAQWYDDILLLLPVFSARRVHIESVKYQKYQGIYDADVWSHSLSVHQQWTNAFHAISGYKKGEIWSKLDCPL